MFIINSTYLLLFTLRGSVITYFSFKIQFFPSFQGTLKVTLITIFPVRELFLLIATNLGEMKK